MVARNTLYATPQRAKIPIEAASGPKLDGSIGYCLKCGSRVSRCGIPFTAEIVCPACGALNVYEESQQPVRLLLQ
jgi:hypothetical protein